MFKTHGQENYIPIRKKYNIMKQRFNLIYLLFQSKHRLKVTYETVKQCPSSISSLQLTHCNFIGLNIIKSLCQNVLFVSLEYLFVIQITQSDFLVHLLYTFNSHLMSLFVVHCRKLY